MFGNSDRGLKRVLWAFVGVLGYSRYLMVRLVWSNSTGETLEAIQHMLQELGGVPARITSDNPKCFAIKACKYDPILNPTFERFGAHYGITLECLPPADPQKKGKVERAMPYVRRLLEPLGEWKNLEHAQLFLNKQLELANNRTHGTTGKQPIVVFTAIEADALKPLPVLAYDPEIILTVKVNRDGHVRFDHKYYSTPQEYIGQEVMVIASSTTITIYQNGKLIDTHLKLLRNDNQSKSTKMSHRKACEQNMEDHEDLLRRALLVGSHCFNLITKLLQVNVGYIALRKAWGVLSLDKTYSHALIDQACQIALEYDQKGYQAVRKILETGLPNSSTKLENNLTEAKILKFVRPMSVYKERTNPLLSTKKGN